MGCDLCYFNTFTPRLVLGILNSAVITDFGRLHLGIGTQIFAK